MLSPVTRRAQSLNVHSQPLPFSRSPVRQPPGTIQSIVTNSQPFVSASHQKSTVSNLYLSFDHQYKSLAPLLSTHCLSHQQTTYLNITLFYLPVGHQYGGLFTFPLSPAHQYSLKHRYSPHPVPRSLHCYLAGLVQL